MAQHDYVISNGTGAAVRSDLNNALLAIVSQNSGATEPTTTYAYQWWADTTTGLLKIRNSANNAWITLRELDGTLTVEDGTVSAPGLAFRDDLNTGIWRPGTDQFAISTNGIERVEWGTSEVVFNDGGTNYDFRIEGDNNANLLFVDASADAVGIGTSSPSSLLHLSVATAASDGTKGVRITNPAGTAAMFECGSSNDSYVGTTSGSDFSIRTNNTSRIYVTNGGNVGIGNNSPSSFSAAGNQLVVGSGSGNNGVTIYAGSTSVSSIFFADGISSPATNIGAIQYSHSNDSLVLSTGDQTRATIDSSGRLLVGTSSARGDFFNSSSYTPRVQIEGTDGTGTAMMSLVNNSTAGAAPYFILGLQKSGSSGGDTIVGDGNDLGYITFQGNDGSEMVEAATIKCSVDGTPGANDMPGRLVFSTTADGASSPTERMRLASNGDLTCPGVYSNTTATAANVVVSTSPYYILRSTSSIKYKTNVEDIDPAYSAKLLDCRPVWFRSTCSIDNPNWSHWGFIAEEVASIDPRLVHWKTKDRITQEDGTQVEVELETPEPEGVQYDRFVPHLLNLIKQQQKAIEDLQAEVAALKAQ